jgi:hypothetical protein
MRIKKFTQNATKSCSLSPGEYFQSRFGYVPCNILDVTALYKYFCSFRNPNLPSDLGLDWIPYTRKHQHYLQISRDMTSANVKQRWNTRRVNFWENILPRIIKAAQCHEPKNENLNQETCNKDNSCSP